MENTGIKKAKQLALTKVDYLNDNPLKMFLYAMMAGQFLVLAGVMSYSIAATLNTNEYMYPIAKLSIGFTYSIGLSLIIYCGAELFTGDIMVLFIGVFKRCVKLGDALKFLLVVYVGNFAGILLFAGIIHMTGLLDNQALMDIINSSAQVKMALPMGQTFWRGVLCNMLVCLAVWSVVKHDSKLVEIVTINWCVLGFVASGYEHSIANMSLFMLSLINPLRPDTITWSGFLNNILPATLGNMIGAIVFVALQYYIIGVSRKSDRQLIMK